MLGSFIKSIKVGAVEAKVINILRRTYGLKPTEDVRHIVHSCMDMVEYFRELEIAVYALGLCIKKIEVVNDRSTELVSKWVSITKQLISEGSVCSENCAEGLFKEAKGRFGIE